MKNKLTYEKWQNTKQLQVDNWLMKFQVDETASWRNENYTNWHNDKLAKWQVDLIESW